MQLARIINTLLFCILLSGCGFSLRSNQTLPQPLHTVYFSPQRPYSPLTLKLKSLLTAMQVTFKNTPGGAGFSVMITDDRFSSTRAAVTNANLPSTIDYLQTATIILKNNTTNQIVATQSFSTSLSLQLNANQIYMPTSDDELKNTLNQEIVTQIYYWLTSTNIKNLLDHAS